MRRAHGPPPCGVLARSGVLLAAWPTTGGSSLQFLESSRGFFLCGACCDTSAPFSMHACVRLDVAPGLYTVCVCVRACA